MRHDLKIRLLAFVAVAALGTGVSACGASIYSPTSGASGEITAASTQALATAGTASASRLPTSGPTATPGTQVTPVTTITPGSVTVTTDHTLYSSNESIRVTISNGFAVTIYATDHHTACSYVDLQHLENGSWQVVGKCALMTPTRIVPLAAGSMTTQLLAPGVSQISAAPWSAGIYRIAFAYFVGGDEAIGKSTVVYSADFTIG
jgi:hypothetical protein